MGRRPETVGTYKVVSPLPVGKGLLKRHQLDDARKRSKEVIDGRSWIVVRHDRSFLGFLVCFFFALHWMVLSSSRKKKKRKEGGGAPTVVDICSG